MANAVAGLTGVEVITLLDEVTQSAAEATKSLDNCRDLHQVLSSVKPQTIVDCSASPGAVENWVQDLEPLLKGANNLLAQALAWEEQSASLPQPLVLLTRQKWSRLIKRVTDRIKQVHAHANLESKIKQERESVFSNLGTEETEDEGEENRNTITLDNVQYLQARLGRLEVGGRRKPPPLPNVLESWKGWYEEEGLRYSMTATLFLTSTNRLCGYGSDALGEWTWEGENAGIHQVLLQKQYVSRPDYSIQYSGTRFVKEGKEMLEGFWSVLPGPTNSGTFLLEREEESAITTAHGKPWSGCWKSGTEDRWTGDTEFVFTSNNRLFGFGSDRGGKVTYTGNYYQEGSVLKITCLKLYQPHSSSLGLQFWGEISRENSQRPVVMEGEWRAINDQTVGSFRLQSAQLVSGPSITSPQSSPTTVAELESWEGWFNQLRERKHVTAQAFLMDGTRPCGFGLDSLGEWTWEGDFVDDDRMLLRKQYVNNPSYRLLYDGIRTAESEDEVIRGRWGFADRGEAFEPPHAQKFCLIKVPLSSAGTKGYGQHWTGHRELVVGTQQQEQRSCRFLDGGALVLTSSHRIFGYGSDVQGTYTYLGKFSREGHTIKVRMVKVYAPGQACNPVQYRGQMDVGCLPAATTVMQGSWASADGQSSGTFRLQAQELDLDTLLA